MPRRRDHEVVDRDDPNVLLGLLEAFDDSVVVGFEPSRDHVDVHVAPLPADARSGSAGLFGMVAPTGWTAVGVALVGRARELDTREVVGAGANAAVVVSRDGRRASRMHLEGVEGRQQRDRRAGDGLSLGSGGQGLVVDALHRMLGLPSPGRPPSGPMLATAIWTHLVLELLLVEGTVDWDAALALHPGDPGPGPVGPSDEMLVEATVRSADGFCWSHVHARAAAGATAVHGLTTREAGWMDTTMFARWVTGALPEPSVVAAVLRSHGCDLVAERLQRVADGVARLAGAEPQGSSG